MSLRREMLAHLRTHDDLPSAELATTFLKTRTKGTLTPLLAEEFDHLRRSVVRSLELKVLQGASSPGRVTTAESVRAGLLDLGVLLDQPYHNGEGVQRRGGEMTERDWLTRKAMLLAQRDGIDRAVAVCDRAIEAIRTAGVSTLDEFRSQMVAAAA